MFDNPDLSLFEMEQKQCYIKIFHQKLRKTKLLHLLELKHTVFLNVHYVT